MPEPDAVSAPSEAAMQGLVADQIKQKNGSASPIFDCVAPLILLSMLLWCALGSIAVALSE